MKNEKRRNLRLALGTGKSVPSSTKIADSTRVLSKVFRTGKYYKKPVKIFRELEYNEYYFENKKLIDSDGKVTWTIPRIEIVENPELSGLGEIIPLTKSEARLAFVLRTEVKMPRKYVYCIEQKLVNKNPFRGHAWYNSTLAKLHAKGLYTNIKFFN